MGKKAIILVLLVAIGGFAVAQTADHTVTVTVSAINELSVDSNVTLTVNEAVAGEDPKPATATSTLLWTTNVTPGTIKASISPALALGFTLSVTAASDTGTSAGETNLSETDVAVISGIGQSAGSAALTYKLAATAEAGVLTATGVTVTYTIVAE